MLYNLFEYLNNNYDLVGSGVFQYLSFRAGMAAIFSLIISILSVSYTHLRAHETR